MTENTPSSKKTICHLLFSVRTNLTSPASSTLLFLPKDSHHLIPCAPQPRPKHLKQIPARSVIFSFMTAEKKKCPYSLVFMNQHPEHAQGAVFVKPRSLCLCLICLLQYNTCIKQSNRVCFNKAILSSCLMIHGVK